MHLLALSEVSVNLVINENKILIVSEGGCFNGIKYSSPSKCTRHEGYREQSGIN